jgi:hypothetical protein
LFADHHTSPPRLNLRRKTAFQCVFIVAVAVAVVVVVVVYAIFTLHHSPPLRRIIVKYKKCDVAYWLFQLVLFTWTYYFAIIECTYI